MKRHSGEHRGKIVKLFFFFALGEHLDCVGAAQWDQHTWHQR